MAAVLLSGAEVGADHGDRCRADAEDQRNQQELETGADTVAGQRGLAELGNETGDEDDRGDRGDGRDRGHQAGAKQIGEMPPLDGYAGQSEAQAAATAQEVNELQQRAEAEAQHSGQGRPADTEGWHRSWAEHEQVAGDDLNGGTDDHEARGHLHLAAATNDAGEDVGQPESDRPAEQQV